MSRKKRRSRQLVCRDLRKDQPDIQGLVKQASEAFNTYKRHYVTYDKLNSAIRARINELNKEGK